ncbi:protein jag [Janibacter sp. GS2]|uniref:Jag family protein n=1 Tax=Janibacter sp. GS2 TaxID=3442646 RepID=UPI003EB7D03D
MSENTTTEVETDATASTPSTGPDTSGPETSGPGEPRKRTRRQLLEREGEVAADFLETLLDIADLDGDIDLDIDGDRAAVAVVDSDEGRVPRRLVGQDGKVLEALQELTRLAVQSDTGDRSRLMLDVAGHRAARRAELVGIAGRAVASVKESGQSLDLEPMTAFERKVVHDEVLAAGLVSDSSGSEPRRFVVVHPAEEAEADSDGPATQTTGTESTVADEATDEAATADRASGQAVGDDTSDPA